MKVKKLSGVLVPICTPFSNGKVDIDKLEINMEKFSQTELQGYFALGSNGENCFLDQEERVLKNQALANVNLLERTYILNRKMFLEERIREAEESGEEGLIDELLQEVSVLSSKLVELDNEFE